MSSILAGVFTVGITTLLALYRAVFLMLLWGLFAVPLGAPPLSWGHAAGLLMIAAAVHPRPGVTFLDAERNQQADAAWVNNHVAALRPPPVTDAAVRDAVTAAQQERAKRRLIHAVKGWVNLNIGAYPLMLAVAYILHRLM